MGHPHEEFVRKFFESLRPDTVFFTISDIVRMALMDYDKYLLVKAKGEK